MKTAGAFILAVLLAGCSLKYGLASYDEQSAPEFSFADAVFNRYEDNTRTLSLTAARLEQYKDGKTTCAKDVVFKLYESDGTLDTEGECGLLSADTDAEKYVLYDKIKVHSIKDDIEVNAATIRWNGKSEQLTSGRDGLVTLKKGGTVLQGSGFSASGVSRRFSFTGLVTGEVQTQDGQEDEEPDAGAASVPDAADSDPQKNPETDAAAENATEQ